MEIFNYDGFEIERIKRPKSKSSEEFEEIREVAVPVPDIMSPISPNFDDIESQLNLLLEKNRKEDEDLASIFSDTGSFFNDIASASQVKISKIDVNFKKHVPIKIEKEEAASSQLLNLVAEEEEALSNDGAAGLWGKSSGLPCFKSPMEINRMPMKIENVQLQKSSYEPPVEPTPVVNELINLAKDPLVMNIEEVNCQMCKRELVRGQAVVLKDCLHPFCRRCLVHALENNETAVMTCPSLSVKCEGEIRDEEVKALLTEEAYEKYTHEQLARLDIFELEEAHANLDYVETKLGFKCNICLEMIPAGEGLTLKSCLHDFCKKCLVRYIENSATSEVKCPFRNEANEQCVGFLYDSEVRSFVSGDVYIKHLNKSLAESEADPNAYHCKTPNCKYFVIIEDEFVEEFECEICKRTNCVKCKTVHQGITCADYRSRMQNDVDYVRTEDQVRNELAARIVQPCPRCGIAVQRNGGCPNMTCTRCGTNFVWR